MAFLMFFTSMGFTLDVHYCQNEIQSISVVGKAKSCDELTKPHCHHAAGACHKAEVKRSGAVHQKPCHTEISGKECQKDCCQNKSIQVKNLDKDSLTAQIPAPDIAQVQFVFAFVSTFYSNSVFNQAFPNPKFLNYSPPLIETDLQLLFESFLI